MTVSSKASFPVHTLIYFCGHIMIMASLQYLHKHLITIKVIENLITKEDLWPMNFSEAINR